MSDTAQHNPASAIKEIILYWRCVGAETCGSMFKFVATDADSIKRKHAPTRACESCRKRKKRCDHNLTGGDGGAAADSPLSSRSSRLSQTASEAIVDHAHGPSTSPAQAAIGAIPRQTPPGSSAQQITEQHLTVPKTSRPGRTQTSTSQGYETSDSRFIGDLSPESVFHSATSPEVAATRGAASSDSVGVWLAKRNFSQAIQSPFATSQNSLFRRVAMPILQDEIEAALPAPAHSNALTELYFGSFNKVFPMIDEGRFNALSVADPGRKLLLQGICLAASKMANAKEFLVLPGSESILSCRQFGNKISAAMKLTIDLNFVTDKLVLIQALSILSHFTDGPDCADICSQLCSRAVHHSQTIGLHIQDTVSKDWYPTTILCCVWALDRINAAFYGRPVMIHERDFGLDVREFIAVQETGFRLLLNVVEVLDRVIGLYRPRKMNEAAIVEVEVPAFEELVERGGEAKLHTSLLATIETLYHAVSILSCRSQTWSQPNRSSPSYLRQTLSSNLITTIVSPEHRDQLIPFPFVHYAVSLSLSVSYREMRHNKIAMQRSRARVKFQECCDILRELGEVFWSAAAMADMGRATLMEMDRVLANLVVGENGNGAVTRNQSRRQSRVFGACGANGQATADHALAQDADQPPLPPSGNLDPGFGNNSIQEFDPSMFDAVSDMDLFGMFDPSFDLSGIDAALGGNLDLSMPNFIL